MLRIGIRSDLYLCCQVGSWHPGLMKPTVCAKGTRIRRENEGCKRDETKIDLTILHGRRSKILLKQYEIPFSTIQYHPILLIVDNIFFI